MSGMVSREDLVKKFGQAFEDANRRVFAVEFPDITKKLVLKPLIPRRYKQFMERVQSALDKLIDVGLAEFQLKDGTSVKGTELIDRNEDGAIKEILNHRVKTKEGDIQEFPKESVKKVIKVSSEEAIGKYEKILWENAQTFLQLLFPEDAENFTVEYIDQNLHVPFMRTLWDLVVELNGLEDIVPFVKKMFTPEEEGLSKIKVKK